MEITVQQVELLSDDDYIYLDVRGEIAYQHGQETDRILQLWREKCPDC